MESKRQKQVGELIKRNFGTVLMQEGSYIYQNALVTVTNVKLSPDLSIAKIYLSIYNTDDQNKDSVIQAMNQNLHRLKHALAHRIRKHVRRIPQIAFYSDETIDEMYRVNDLLDNIDTGHYEEE